MADDDEDPLPAIGHRIPEEGLSEAEFLPPEADVAAAHLGASTSLSWGNDNSAEQLTLQSSEKR